VPLSKISRRLGIGVPKWLYTTTQAPDRDDILNIGGFGDAVFQVVAAFFAGDSGRFVNEVEAIEL
jgi:60 kDa SS-A/Ro ribonucleoprotein